MPKTPSQDDVHCHSSGAERNLSRCPFDNVPDTDEYYDRTIGQAERAIVGVPVKTEDDALAAFDLLSDEEHMGYQGLNE
jgi:hypothetical protein